MIYAYNITVCQHNQLLGTQGQVSV